ncbi:MAG: GspE/PulE family protein [Bacillota bacterium]|nr:GspE/PulE family protein [Bacillota bacterium]MDI7248768.1 GspE/PulE family protein [Bacillota bacterium]
MERRTVPASRLSPVLVGELAGGDAGSTGWDQLAEEGNGARGRAREGPPREGTGKAWEGLPEEGGDARVKEGDEASSERIAFQVQARRMGVPYVDLNEIDPDEDVLRIIPEELARRYRAVAVQRQEGGKLLTAMVNPMDVLAIDHLRMVVGAEIAPALCTENQVMELINRAYRLDEVVEHTLKEVGGIGEAERHGAPTPTAEADAPVVRLVNTIITQAVRQRASDIHLDAGEREMRVRFRVDGVLTDFMKIPRAVLGPVISRLKVMGGMDIGERRLPQDGRCSVRIEGREVDIRVATIPTVHGEKATLRILDKATALLPLEDLGFSPEQRRTYERLVTQPYGMFLVTGPTGSGKTTTLYATLAQLNDPGKHVITMEDPVEYHLKGVNQVQVNRKAGLVFASGLRSILRLDPDVVLVGEIRDRETAEIAVQSALTGHLVLSTLHTNDAPGALTRLVEMGIEPFLVASSVIGVLAQRLVRRLCPHCLEHYELPASAVKGFPAYQHLVGKRLARGRGCPRCGGTGYRGRVAVFELLEVTDAVRGAVLRNASADEIGRIGRAEGMTTLFESALAKVEQGVTTLEEVLRVVRLGGGVNNGHRGSATAATTDPGSAAGGIGPAPHRGVPPRPAHRRRSRVRGRVAGAAS